MRVVDRSTARNYMKYLNKARSDYASTNEKIASGKRFDKISQDVIAGTKVLRVRTDLCKAETQLGNIKSAQEELRTTELAMTAINNILTSASAEKINAALSEDKGEVGRIAIANEIEAMRNEILQYANTKYSSRYVFGGSNSSYTAPFSINSDGKLLYNGINVDLIQQDIDGSLYYMNAGVKTKISLDTDVYLDIGLGIKLQGTAVDPNTGFKISYSGLELLGFGRNSEGISNNIFNVLTEIENNIRNYDFEKLNNLHSHFRTLCDSFRANLTDIGAKTKHLDTMEERLNNSIDSYMSRINTLMGIDDAEEVMNQSMNEYVLKAVIQMGAKLLPVTLMDFLR
jgi:flagellin-like hook-associated protein FlgL